MTDNEDSENWGSTCCWLFIFCISLYALLYMGYGKGKAVVVGALLLIFAFSYYCAVCAWKINRPRVERRRSVEIERSVEVEPYQELYWGSSDVLSYPVDDFSTYPVDNFSIYPVDNVHREEPEIIPSAPPISILERRYSLPSSPAPIWGRRNLESEIVPANSTQVQVPRNTERIIRLIDDVEGQSESVDLPPAYLPPPAYHECFNK